MELGAMLNTVVQSMYVASGTSRWARDRARRTGIVTTHNADPLAGMITHIERWQAGCARLFTPSYIEDRGFRAGQHQSRCFLLVLKKFDSAEDVANRLLTRSTRIAIPFRAVKGEERCVDETKMRDAMMYVFRFPGCYMADAKNDTGREARSTTYVSDANVRYVSDANVRDIPKAISMHDLPTSITTTSITTTTTSHSMVANKKQRTDRKQSTVDPTKQHPAPVPNMASKQSSVGPAKQSTVDPTKQSTVDPTKESTVDPTKHTAPSPKLTTKHIVMVVLPKGVPVSSKAFFNEMHDITPLGCVMSSHFPLMITKTCWRSLQTTPVDNWGKWKHIGLGKDEALHPHMLRISVAQASTVGE